MEYKEKQEKDSWDTFFHTGRVEDYLRYASGKIGESGNAVSTMHGYAEERASGEVTDGVGDRPYAGFYSSDRDYTEAESHRGIR